TGPYAAGKEKYGFEGLVTPVINGKPFYQAYLIVRKDSPFRTLMDLKGHTFAFTDPDSNTGALVPRYWLSQLGQTPDTFFNAVIFTHSHDNSIMAVAKSMVDGACVGSPFWDYFQARNPVYTSRTRIIKKSEWFGGPPLVAAKHLSVGLKSKIRHLLVEMNDDPDGKNILDKLRIDSFRPTEEPWYATVNQMKRDIKNAGLEGQHVEKH
ncbi:MAG: PhnD/SsuA/transferrin family substrate-binding protein, partial [Deltaproteobacteria bacterium]|nr:PhnD/SsuA/transferrin family substrate-binding protein [Deltaproteobacteria bacterium]